jgi:molecular chaperone GrpE
MQGKQHDDASAQSGDMAAAVAELNKLTDELTAAKQELDRLRDIAGRSQADLQNAKDRLAREAADLRAFAAAGIVQRLLPTVDNFRRAFAHLPPELAAHDWVRGVQAVEQELLRQLEEAGLKRIDCIGKPADPAHCEVLQTAPGEKDVVLEVFEDGYEFGGRILRPAKVKVGDGN